MRLLVIDPGLRLWGSERALLATLPSLLEAYDSVTVLTPPRAELAQEAAKLGVAVEIAPIGNLHRTGHVSRAIALACIVKACRDHGVDAIYLNQAGLCRLVNVAARLLRLPLVIHVRLLEDIPRCARLRPQSVAPVSLVFVSNDMMQRYMSLAPRGERKQLVMAYDVVEMDHCDRRPALPRLLSIACLGRIEAGKGQRELVEAIGLLAAEGCSIRAELIGAADEEDAYVRALKARIAELHLDGSVAIRGYMPGASALLAEHRFAVVSSKYESFGRVVAEAWAAGALPIVSSDSGGAAELVSASSGGLLFEGHSPEQLARTLAKAALLSEADRRAQVSAGRKWARAHLSMDECRRALGGVLFHPAARVSLAPDCPGRSDAMKASTSLSRRRRKALSYLPDPIADSLRAAKRAVLNRRPPADVFRRIFVENAWDGTESVSGPGSTMAASANIRAALPRLLRELNVRTLLDAPCGDAHWISTCLPTDVRYIGGDIVAEIIERNRTEWSGLGEFLVMDLVSDDLPEADLILVRDCFIHLPNAWVRKALANIQRAKIGYLLTTTFPDLVANADIEVGGFRPVNLQASPFNLPPPERLVVESESAFKQLGLWRLSGA